MVTVTHSFANWHESTLARADEGGYLELAINGPFDTSFELEANPPSAAKILRPKKHRMIVRFASITSTPLEVFAVGEDVFPAETTVTARLSHPGGDLGAAHVIENIPLAGHVRAPLFKISMTDLGEVVAQRLAFEADIKGLAGWNVVRRRDLGRANCPPIVGVVVDTSTSMRVHKDRIARLIAYLRDTNEASGFSDLKVEYQGGGTQAVSGVGSLEVNVNEKEGLWIAISDLPLGSKSLPTIVLSDPKVVNVLSSFSAPSFSVWQDFWNALDSEDIHDLTTTSSLDDLADWLASLTPRGGAA